ncbi:hypothetical protein [Diaphorobacter sp.]|uniref:TubC N-terminal docking domain-related protein n=1 Tax=Diaphorobacter sp. TaxID=1934310 RepID=UPI0028B180E3|nr:hypothetical protein [Diaphorobacter sp.]
MLGDLLNRLDAAGIHLEMEGEFITAPAGVLTDDLRQSIREHRDELVQWLTSEAANDAHHEPPPHYWKGQTRWRERSTAYYLHHFGCADCIAAGRGAGYGERCADGAGLWAAYQDASRGNTHG